MVGCREILILLTALTMFGKWLSNCVGNELFESVFSTHRHLSVRHMDGSIDARPQTCFLCKVAPSPGVLLHRSQIARTP